MDARRTGAAKDQKDHVAPTHVASSGRGTLIRDGHGTDCIMDTGSSLGKEGDVINIEAKLGNFGLFCTQDAIFYFDYSVYKMLRFY